MDTEKEITNEPTEPTETQTDAPTGDKQASE